MKYSEFRDLSEEDKQYNITNLYCLLSIVFFEFVQGKSNTLSKYQNTVEECMFDKMHLMYDYASMNKAIISFKGNTWKGITLTEGDIVDYYNGIINKGSVYFYLYYNCMESFLTFNNGYYISLIADAIDSLDDTHDKLNILNKYLFNREALKKLDGMMSLI